MGIQSIKDVTTIVSAGSVDGVLATAAFLRMMNKFAGSRVSDAVEIIFTQPHLVNTIKVDNWPKERKVVLLDLAVNNRDENMSKAFVDKITAQGHTILGIADEHDRAAWAKFVKIDELLIQPQTRGGVYTSACAILRQAFNNDEAVAQMLEDGDKADAMQFKGFAESTNNAVKSAITSAPRREHIARHFAVANELSAQMTSWAQEYVQMETNKPLIIATREDLGAINGISMGYYNGNIGVHDATAVFSEAYKKDQVAFLATTRAEASGLAQVITIATSEKRLDLTKSLTEAGIIHLGGMAARMSIKVEDKEKAINAVRGSISKL